MNTFNRGLVLLSLVLLAFPHPGSAASNPAEKKVILTVAEGDTLLDICGKYLEDQKNCGRVARINHLKNPDRIYPAQKLAVPVSFLKGTPMDGLVTFIKGDVRVQEKKGGEWAVLRLRDHVHEGSGLKTGAASALEITFEDGSTIFQSADTTLELSATRQGPLHLLRDLFLLGGRAITRVKSATGREQRFIIRTPSASAAMRGTDLRVSSDAVATTRSEVLTGIVDVAAQGKDVEVRGNEGTVVKKGLPPLAPRKLLPPPQAILRPPFNKFPLEVRFTGIPGATAYRVMLTRDREGKDIVREDAIKPDAPLLVGEIEDGPYYVQGMSIDDAGLTGIASEPTLLHVRVNPLPPFLRSPVAGAELRSQTVDIDWLKVGDAAAYHLQIAADRDFTKMVAEIANLKDVGYTTKSLEFGKYFFRVRSIAADGYEGGWSDIQSFAVVPPPPVPSVEKPALDDNEIHIKWRDLGAGYIYHCQVARDKEFKEVLVDRKLAKPEITIEKPKPGTYFVRTSAIDDKGFEGGFSPPQVFEVKRRFPYGALGLLVPIGVILILVL